MYSRYKHEKLLSSSLPASSPLIPLPPFFFFSIQDCLHALSHFKTHFSLGNISKLHFKHFSELPRTSGGHFKKISPYDLHYSTHLLDCERLLQQSEWI